MKMQSVRWPVLTLALAVGLSLVVLTAPDGWAEDSEPPGSATAREVDRSPTIVGQASLGAAPAGLAPGIQSIAGSGVDTLDCYQPDKLQTLCFTIRNGSPDGDWISDILLTFPNYSTYGPWQVSCNPALDDISDTAGYPVDFSCSTPNTNQILYTDNAGGWVGISPGAGWSICVDLTVPASYDGPRLLDWLLSGYGQPSPDTQNGKTEIERCTPLTLKPAQQEILGCNGTPQRLEFELHNYTASAINADLHYSADGAAFGGPASLQIGAGQLVTFTTDLEPGLCLEPGAVIVAGLTAEGGGHMDSATITETITANAGWHRRDDSPVPSMDNVVIWASHQDGGLWSIGGEHSGGAAQRYDPTTGVWITYTTSLTPAIEYPMDGCYGLNDQGQEIVVLFPDTIVTDTLQVFNITTHQWSTRPIPDFFPPEYVGSWGYDVVSLLGNPALRPGLDGNLCYLSGGANQTGGGRERNLWLYDPATNGGQWLGHFVADIWFGFHASWYVPWIGDQGAICVAGGIRHDAEVTNATQCYDIAAKAFHNANVDLGTLPEPWWGMADGWQITDQGYELWIANGVAQNGSLLPASAYFREGMTGFSYGPPVPDALYRLEGDSFQGQFFTLNGSRGAFWSSEVSLQLAPCPACHKIFTPLIMRNN